MSLACPGHSPRSRDQIYSLQALDVEQMIVGEALEGQPPVEILRGTTARNARLGSSRFHLATIHNHLSGPLSMLSVVVS